MTTLLSVYDMLGARIEELQEDIRASSDTHVMLTKLGGMREVSTLRGRIAELITANSEHEATDHGC